MDGATVRLPSGRLLSETTDYAQTRVDERAYLVARTMWVESEGERYFGTIGKALDSLWKTDYEKSTSGISHRLHRNGFTASWTGGKKNSGNFYWQVPSVFPIWNSNRDTVEDDGSSPEAGPVHFTVVTDYMRSLMRAVESGEARTPREYAAQLGWPKNRVKNVAASLKKGGWIEATGNTQAVRYHLTGKPFPHPKPEVEKVVVVNEPKPEPITVSVRELLAETNTGDDIERATGGTVVYDKHGHLLVLKDGKLHTATMSWVLTEVQS
jgi:hypothetical protein